MTQDEPERAEAEETATPEKLRALADDYQKGPSNMASDSLINDNWQDKPHRLVYSLCTAIRWAADALSVSEKRAEEAEARAEKLRELQIKYCLALGKEEVAHDERLAAVVAERDSSQASLLRVEAALKLCAERFKEYGVAHMAKQPPDIDKAKRNYEMFDLCRTALSPHKET